MGDWAIIVRGTGLHHNCDPEHDADHATAVFVKMLKDQGHSIKAATFTTGGEYDLSDPDAYAAQWEKKPSAPESPPPAPEGG